MSTITRSLTAPKRRTGRDNLGGRNRSAAPTSLLLGWRSRFEGRPGDNLGGQEQELGRHHLAYELAEPLEGRPSFLLPVAEVVRAGRPSSGSSSSSKVAARAPAPVAEVVAPVALHAASSSSSQRVAPDPPVPSARVCPHAVALQRASRPIARVADLCCLWPSRLSTIHRGSVACAASAAVRRQSGTMFSTYSVIIVLCCIQSNSSSGLSIMEAACIAMMWLKVVIGQFSRSITNSYITLFRGTKTTKYFLLSQAELLIFCDARCASYAAIRLWGFFSIEPDGKVHVSFHHVQVPKSLGRKQLLPFLDLKLQAALLACELKDLVPKEHDYCKRHRRNTRRYVAASERRFLP
ncbi:unnamed protein product [Trichogramma brassicae]|uniref:Uncharacterized protein n=1 Tax=Trichogramma brassicae TaxID=86971 RepID=A0A6H5HWT3_9HYME|nr:unnamed protein product [Trichogramma brassicae]